MVQTSEGKEMKTDARETDIQTASERVRGGESKRAYGRIHAQTKTQTMTTTNRHN